MKLSDQFNHVQTNILMMEDLLNASLACRLLLQEERHLNMSKTTALTTEPMAFSADKYDRHHSSKVHNHNRNTHVAGGKRTGNTYRCDHFHMNGHTKDLCYKLHGYPNKNCSYLL